MSSQALAAYSETAQVFLKNLRVQTNPAHEQLETHSVSMSITSPHITPADYRRYLQIMQRVMEGAESTLTPLLLPVLPDITRRYKQDWLGEDLGANGSEENPYPRFCLSLKENNSNYALGAFYVLEGSTLGGRVILKSLPAALKENTRYFEGYGPQTGSMWQAFLTILCDAAATASAERSIINGAVDTFADITRYFNTCIAHEASGHCQS